MQVVDPNDHDFLQDPILADLHEAKGFEKASFALQDAGLTFRKIASPMPKQQPEQLGEATLRQELINTYHFFAGYMGTIERLKVFKHFGDQPLHLNQVQQQYIQEMNAIKDKMHMGLFDYIFFGVPFLATWLSLNPEIAYEVEPDTQILHHYRTVTNTTKANSLTPLAILVSGVFALPRLVFGMVLTVLSTPVVLVVHAIAALVSGVKRPRVNAAVNIEAESLLGEANDDDNNNIVEDANALNNRNPPGIDNEDVMMNRVAPAAGAPVRAPAVAAPAFRSSMANMLEQMAADPPADEDEWEYVLVSEEEAVSPQVPAAAADDAAEDSYTDSEDEDRKEASILPTPR
jgi:hypothetical protein